MNILLMGKSDSIFTRDFCLQVLNNGHNNVTVLTREFTEQYEKDYIDNNIKEVKWPDFFLNGVLKQKGIIKKTKQNLALLKDEIGFGNKIDVLFMHYFEPMHLIYFFSFWRRAGKRIIVLWGSDLYSASKKKRLLFPYFFKQAAYIVLMIPNQLDYFKKMFGNKYDNKIQIIDFGNSLLDVIDNVSREYTLAECRQRFGFAPDKTIVHVGYNAALSQQHMSIMKNAVLLPQEILDGLQFVFHVSYGRENDFENDKTKLIEIMSSVNLNYKFVDSYLQGEELAMFRRTCDIFLYGQKTDARSESPLEYIYAGATFVCPGWLAGNYELLDQADIRYYVYKDFAELPDVFLKCLGEGNFSERKISEKSRRKIRDEISWDSLAEKWRALYE